MELWSDEVMNIFRRMSVTKTSKDAANHVLTDSQFLSFSDFQFLIKRLTTSPLSVTIFTK